MWNFIIIAMFVILFVYCVAVSVSLWYQRKRAEAYLAFIKTQSGAVMFDESDEDEASGDVYFHNFKNGAQ